MGWWDLSIPRVLWGAWIGNRDGRKGNWHRTHASFAEDFDLYALVASDRIIHGEEFLGISIHFSARSNFSWRIMIQLQEIFYVGHQEDCDEMRKEIYKLNYCNITPLLTLDSLKVSEDTRNTESLSCLMLGDCSSSALKVVYWKSCSFLQIKHNLIAIVMRNCQMNQLYSTDYILSFYQNVHFHRAEMIFWVLSQVNLNECGKLLSPSPKILHYFSRDGKLNIPNRAAKNLRHLFSRSFVSTSTLKSKCQPCLGHLKPSSPFSILPLMHQWRSWHFWAIAF